MRLLLTGGGTGGHIYPALEVGRIAQSHGAELLYFGSIRGQESRACAGRGIPFTGFPSEPLVGVRSLQGVRAVASMLRASLAAKTAVAMAAPDAVFSTGGYGAAPIVWAAVNLNIPYVIHSVDSVPPKSSTKFAARAKAFTCSFRSTPRYMPERKVIRTGHPIRPELRRAAGVPRGLAGQSVFVIGGSQGSEFLNKTVPEAAVLADLAQVSFVHACGPKNYDALAERLSSMSLAGRYRAVPYLEVEELAAAYRSATVVVARSGGTLAEIALFGIPSVLVPLPASASDHQLHNAEEFAELGAAKILRQGRPTGAYDAATPENLAASIRLWLDNEPAKAAAARSLLEWDVPNASERIWSEVARIG